MNWVSTEGRRPTLYETVLFRRRKGDRMVVEMGRLVPLLEWEMGPNKEEKHGFESDIIGSHGKAQIKDVPHWMPIPEDPS